MMAGAMIRRRMRSQAFGKVGWRSETTDVALSGAYADTDLTGNGLQDLQFLERDYDSVYTKPDNTQNKAYLFNLVATQKVSDTLTLSANAYYRNIKTGTFNGDINDDSLGETLYQPNADGARRADGSGLHAAFRRVAKRRTTRRFRRGAVSRTSC